MNPQQEPPLNHPVLGLFDGHWAECYRRRLDDDDKIYWFVMAFDQQAMGSAFRPAIAWEPDDWVELPTKRG